jgi:hypothetical protein
MELFQNKGFLALMYFKIIHFSVMDKAVKMLMKSTLYLIMFLVFSQNSFSQASCTCSRKITKETISKPNFTYWQKNIDGNIYKLTVNAECSHTLLSFPTPMISFVDSFSTPISILNSDYTLNERSRNITKSTYSPIWFKSSITYEYHILVPKETDSLKITGALIFPDETFQPIHKVHSINGNDTIYSTETINKHIPLQFKITGDSLISN